MADMITVPVDAAQSAMNAIGQELFALERDPTMKTKLASLHAALAAGEALILKSAGAGQMKPQDGGGPKSGNPPPG